MSNEALACFRLLALRLGAVGMQRRWKSSTPFFWNSCSPNSPNVGEEVAIQPLNLKTQWSRRLASTPGVAPSTEP